VPQLEGAGLWDTFLEIRTETTSLFTGIGEAIAEKVEPRKKLLIRNNAPSSLGGEAVPEH